MDDPEFEQRAKAFRDAYPPVETPYHDIEIHPVGSIILDADADESGRWVCSTVHAHYPHLLLNGRGLQIDRRSRQVAVRWLDSEHVLAFDGPLGWCAVFDLEGRQTLEFDIGLSAEDVMVTTGHLIVTYGDPEGSDDELAEQTANVFDHAGHHCWGYRDRFGSVADLQGIALVEGPDEVGISFDGRRQLARINVRTAERQLLALPAEMSGDRHPTCRSGTYCFAHNPKSPFLGAFVWRPGQEQIRYLPQGATMVSGVRRGLPGGRVLGWLHDHLFVETIPDEAFAPV